MGTILYRGKKEEGEEGKRNREKRERMEERDGKNLYTLANGNNSK